MSSPDQYLAELLGLAPPGVADDLSDEGLATLWAHAASLERQLPISQHGLDISQLGEFDPSDPVWAGVQNAVLEELAPPIVLPWRRTARPSQLPPTGRWRHWLIMAGRGWGKTFVGSNWLAERALTEPGDYAVVAPTLGDAKKICVEGESGLLAALGGEDGPHVANYNRSEYVVYLTNGSRIILGSADAPQRIRGLNLRGVWCDEVGSWRDITVWNEGIKFATRKGDPRIVITTTPTRGQKILVKLLDRHKEAGGSILGGLAANTFLTRGGTRENVKNLSADWLAEIEHEFAGTTLGRQELDGELLHAVPGALVTLDLIEATRLTAVQVPDLWRVVVGVDPSVSDEDGDGHDECGIVVKGIGPAPLGWQPPPGAPASLADAPHLYTLEDCSIHGTPDEWIRHVLDTAEEWDADCVTAEKNNGHGLVRGMISAIAEVQKRRMPRLNTVWASVGKRTRAEPLGGVWEQHRMHIVGKAKHLEDQWATWVPTQKRLSPDRLDADVWSGVELMPQLGVKPRSVVKVAKR